MAALGAMPGAGGERGRVPRTLRAQGKCCAAAPPERRRAAGAHQGHPCRGLRRLRLAAHLERTVGQRHPLGQATCSEAHDAARHTRQGQAPVQGHHRRQSRLADRTKPTRPAVHRGTAGQGVGKRYHVHRHRRVTLAWFKRHPSRVIAWMFWYNRTRLHSTLAYVSPMQFEANWHANQPRQVSA